ncbi:Serine/threonine-protein phosphatase PP-X isozyme 2 [Aduncisulcus paluster]|uniref:Serine/threonine-protein phosphatase n=1 Tax=Aduncisulcus paluster TaxID=2918883 RepID=A0ABQ5KPI9_9EUKA|nr:Serine/threonine-protein phosphatase PP-X isozyme 2 [Aduncisulcus paluster]
MLKKLFEKIVRGKCPEASEIIMLMMKGAEIIAPLDNVVNIQAPVTVVGDLHGQLFDVLEMFEITGEPPATNFVFLGDYVDRGMYSLETLCLLIVLKVLYPSRIVLIRGNHECRRISSTYGFLEETKKKFSEIKGVQIYRACMTLLDTLPLAAIISGTFFCVHGGLSPGFSAVDELALIYRFKEPPSDGIVADLLWSDPRSDIDEGWMVSERGSGHIFGRQVTKKFLHVNNFAHILRAHQMCKDGFEIMFEDRLSTVWSAPNYMYRSGNVASALDISQNLRREFKIFGPRPEDERIII